MNEHLSTLLKEKRRQRDKLKTLKCALKENERETVTGAAPAIKTCEEVNPDPAISYVDFVSVDEDVAVCGEVIDADIVAKFSTITSRLRIEHLVVPTQSGLMITLVNQSQDHQLGLQTRRILMGQPDFKMAAPDFLQAFWRLYKKAFDLRKAEDELADIIKVDNSGLVMTFELKPLQKFACNVYRLLYECKGSIPLVSFDFMYLRLFAIPCQPALLGYPSLEALLRAIPETVLLRGGIRDQRMLILNKDLAGPKGASSLQNPCQSSRIAEELTTLFPIPSFTNPQDVTSDSNRQTYKNSAELLRNLANGSSHFQTIGEPELDTPAKALRCDSDAPLNQFKLWSPPSFSYYNQACMTGEEVKELWMRYFEKKFNQKEKRDESATEDQEEIAKEERDESATGDQGEIAEERDESATGDQGEITEEKRDESATGDQEEIAEVERKKEPPQVNLPPCPPAPPLSSTVDLLSPEKTLLSAHTLPHVVPPHPSELPLPELPSKKSCNSMDSSFGSNEPGSPSQMRREYQPHLY
uniref:HTH OST-type domain-containing protein n=1 Tax=Timema shepardi TaxID=629360 RepID=A0A7R9AQ17_TIMSH|nr:unnamed protein product [Timema shepardi]